MHFGDSIFIFLLALVLFGPKKLPEIGRTIGKLLAEFRRASNEFKFQIQDELRNMEEDERRKKLAEQQAQKAADAPAAELPAETQAATSSMTAPAAPSILPPSTGTPVSSRLPFASSGDPEAAPTPTAATPSAAEVVVDPPAPTPIAAEPSLAPEPSAHVDLSGDLTAHANGSHPASTEAEETEPGSVSETIHHG
jgi:sec-independent protein translocase protein TatB